jgi:hypothetical protein
MSERLCPLGEAFLDEPPDEELLAHCREPSAGSVERARAHEVLTRRCEPAVTHVSRLLAGARSQLRGCLLLDPCRASQTH